MSEARTHEKTVWLIIVCLLVLGLVGGTVVPGELDDPRADAKNRKTRSRRQAGPMKLSRSLLAFTDGAVSIPAAGLAQPAPASRLGTLNPASGGLPGDIWSARRWQANREISVAVAGNGSFAGDARIAAPRAADQWRRRRAGFRTRFSARTRVVALLKIGDAGEAGALLRTAPRRRRRWSRLRARWSMASSSPAQTEMACLDVRSYAGKFQRRLLEARADRV